LPTMWKMFDERSSIDVSYEQKIQVWKLVLYKM
jgi:hypothetical protein